MPTLPPLGTAPYDRVDAVLDLARTRLNDAIVAGGDVVNVQYAFVRVWTNAAWRRLQEFLANLGYSRLVREVILTNLPAVASRDPEVQVSISWANYFDGVSYYATPVLPQDLILPMKLWERWNGTNELFAPMDQYIDGIPTERKHARNHIWEWREDAIYMPGSFRVMDLRIRYSAYLADFATTGDTPWYQQPIPIMRCLSPLAWYICSEAANARGDMDGAAFDQKAEDEARKIFNRDVAQKQRVNMRRIGRSRHARHGAGLCY